MSRKFFMDARILGEIIRKYRQRKGYSQFKLAALANMNESYLSAVECGYSYITLAKLLSLIRAMDCSPVALIREYTETVNQYLDDNNKYKIMETELVFRESEPEVYQANNDEQIPDQSNGEI